MVKQRRKATVREGPKLEVLLRRMTDCPPEFLAEPLMTEKAGGQSGDIDVAAVVSDLLVDLGASPLSESEAKGLGREVSASEAFRNHLRVTLLLSWLLGDDYFRTKTPVALSQDIRQVLLTGLPELSKIVQAPLFISDSDHREELVRTGLHKLSYYPAGESEAQAADRLTTLSSVERLRVIRASRLAEQRAKEIKEAMALKAAQEAAAGYGRE
jgi:hypothetical protein